MAQGDSRSLEAELEEYPGYRLAATGREDFEGGRLELLEQIFDPGSRNRRERVQPGWRCLEVGAGRGSMAVWLAERVGPSGHVVATDIDLTYLARLQLPNLTVRQHDILEDPLDALEPGSFDVVCSRLTLFWLADRQEEAIRRMVACLRPGGWLLDEDGDWGTAGPVDPSHPLCASYHRAYQAGQWFASRGYDPFFGRRLSSLFERCGLENIGHQATAEVVRGDSPWALWWRDTLDAIRVWGLADGGLTESPEEEHEALIAPCTEPSVWFMTELLHACSGQRPG
jgi:SAM-dependent methyltransferase